jgi:hypothetical protein
MNEMRAKYPHRVHSFAAPLLRTKIKRYLNIDLPKQIPKIIIYPEAYWRHWDPGVVAEYNSDGSEGQISCRPGMVWGPLCGMEARGGIYPAEKRELPKALLGDPFWCPECLRIYFSDKSVTG